MNLPDELSTYISKYETKTNCKPGAIPVTKQEIQELRKILLESYSKDIESENPELKIDLLVMEFHGIDIYEHLNAQQIRAR